MTWGNLAKRIFDDFNDEQRNQDVAVYVTEIDEFVQASELGFNDGENTDVLDEGHPFLSI